jgi:POT family proton-dependent oligopeptide transporter
VIALGHFALAVPGLTTFYAGLILIALGTGLFKPNISAMVGNLYAADDPRRDAGFSLFYMGVNIGGLLAPLVLGVLAQSAMFKSWLAANGFDPGLSWHWGFGAAGVGMAIALAILVTRRSMLAAMGDRPREAPNLALTAAIAVASAVLLAALLLSDRQGFTWLRYVLIGLPLAVIGALIRREDLEARRLIAIFVFFIAAMVFWSLFEQAGLTIAMFADELTNNSVGSFTIPSAWYQSLNPLFVILLTPLSLWLWARLGAGRPSTPLKFALGLTLVALSFALMVPAAYLTAMGRVSPLWLVGLFVLQTMGELCLSPVGLSTMTKLAPPRLVGLMLGVWFLAAAFGNKLAGILGGGFASHDPQLLANFFINLAGMGAAAAVAMFAVTPWMRQLMSGVK